MAWVGTSVNNVCANSFRTWESSFSLGMEPSSDRDGEAGSGAAPSRLLSRY
jgi:hypothetical protein